MKTETRTLEAFRPERYMKEAGVYLETKQIAGYGFGDEAERIYK